MVDGSLNPGAALKMTVFDGLDRLEAGQNQLGAAILDMQQQQACNRSSSCRGWCSIRSFSRQSRSDLVKRAHRLARPIVNWIRRQGLRQEAYGCLVRAKFCRFLAWLTEGVERFKTPSGVILVADCLACAERWEEDGRYILECLKNDTLPHHGPPYKQREPLRGWRSYYRGSSKQLAASGDIV
jgi:hypothetical protein